MINKERLESVFRKVFTMLILGGLFWASIGSAITGYNFLGGLFFATFIILLIEVHYVDYMNDKAKALKKPKRRSVKR